MFHFPDPFLPQFVNICPVQKRLRPLKKCRTLTGIQHSENAISFELIQILIDDEQPGMQCVSHGVRCLTQNSSTAS